LVACFTVRQLPRPTLVPYTTLFRSDADPNALRTKLEAVVNDYNAVVKAIHGAAGFGSVKATNPVLAGDSTLRTVTNRLSSAESPDRKSTRLNSSHVKISYAVFCLKK